ncbi:MAG: ubiquinone/menaquinone biosynthesis C-methylase UbiE [Myxococcota bacterium]|jgi:ubiquinone/menaquinone biosynthesis C-methylase UbiE
MKKWSSACVLISLVALNVPFVASAESAFDEEVRLLADALQVGAGSVIADIGAGEGNFAIALAASVGETGRVYASEMEVEKREEIAEAVADAEASRVEVVVAEFDATGIAEGSCDAIYLRTVYHHIMHPEVFGKSLFETLKPGGRLVIVDFPPTRWLNWFTDQYILDMRGGHGVEMVDVEKELAASGFVKVGTRITWPDSNFIARKYALIFERPAVGE